MLQVTARQGLGVQQDPKRVNFGGVVTQQVARRVSDEERPEARIDEFVLEDAPDLLQDE